jgi:hypothetical protein
MINEPIKIINLETLQQEKQRLKMYSSYQEELLKNKITYIKQNTNQFIGEQFLPYESNENKKINNVIDTANQFIFEKYLGFDLSGKNKIAGLFLKLSEVIIVRLFKHFKKK